MSPRVSVVIPAYNNADYIVETVESVLGQSFADFEVVVADHESSDDTWNLLQRYADHPRVRLLRTPAGGGAERNWNRVTEAATGDLVKLVCADDLVYRDMLATQVAAFDMYGARVVMVASPRDIVDATGRPIVRNHGLGGLHGIVDGRRAVRRAVRAGTNIFGEPACVMFRRAALVDAGGWHGDPGYLIDQGTYSRVLLRGDLAVTAGPLAAFRVSASQWSVRLAKEQASSTAEMHAQLARLEPGLLSRADIRIGNARAVVRAVQRRLVYLYLGRRMRPAQEAEI